MQILEQAIEDWHLSAPSPLRTRIAYIEINETMIDIRRIYNEK